MPYKPGMVPANINFLGDYVQRELNRVAEFMGGIEDVWLNETHVLPTKPRDGLIVFADGTNWDPGSGRGVYVYDNGWKLIANTHKAGTATIANTSATVSVTFTTAFPDANYSVTISTDGNEFVWVTSKAAGGFTLNRLLTAGARNVDWLAVPYEDQ